jgi:hypothetical protein
VEQTRMEDVQKHLEAMLAPKLRVQMQRALEALSPAGSAEKIALLIETSAKGAPV